MWLNECVARQQLQLHMHAAHIPLAPAHLWLQLQFSSRGQIFFCGGQGGGGQRDMCVYFINKRLNSITLL
jgi:hypothetical protein